MTFGRFVWLAVAGAVLALPLAAYAQDATLNGTVRDNTGGVLPGVTVTATHEAAGTTFVGVTDEPVSTASCSAPVSTASPQNCRDSRPWHGPASNCW